MFSVTAFAPYAVRVVLIMIGVFLVAMGDGFSLVDILSFNPSFQLQVQLIRVY